MLELFKNVAVKLLGCAFQIKCLNKDTNLSMKLFLVYLTLYLSTLYSKCLINKIGDVFVVISALIPDKWIEFKLQDTARVSHNSQLFRYVL